MTLICLVLYLLENKRMRLFLKRGPSYAPIFEYAPIFKQAFAWVVFLDIFSKKYKGKALYAPIFDVRLLLGMSLFSSKYSI